MYLYPKSWDIISGAATPPPPSTSSEDYFQSVVIAALLKILSDQSQAASHHQIIDAIMSMFKTGVKCIGFLPKVCSHFKNDPLSHLSAVQIIPAFTNAARTATARVQGFHLHQLAILISIISAHIRNFTPQIFALVTGLSSFPSQNSTYRLSILRSMG